MFKEKQYRIAVRYWISGLIVFILTTNTNIFAQHYFELNPVLMGKTERVFLLNSADSITTPRKFVTDRCDIILNDSLLLKSVRITALEDSLIKTENDYERKINLSSINIIRFKTGIGPWGGAAIGAGFCVALGLILEVSGDFKGGMIELGLAASLGGALIGGLIGYLAQGLDTYDFYYDNREARLKRMNDLIRKHSNK